MGHIWDRRTWIGLLAALLLLLVLFAAVAFLVGKEWLSETAIPTAVCISYSLAAVLGGSIAARGKGNRLLRSMTVCALLYAVIWIAALSSGGAIRFGATGVWITAALVGGALLAALIAPVKAAGEKRTKRGRKRTNVRKRPVT